MANKKNTSPDQVTLIDGRTALAFAAQEELIHDGLDMWKQREVIGLISAIASRVEANKRPENTNRRLLDPIKELAKKATDNPELIEAKICASVLKALDIEF